MSNGEEQREEMYYETWHNSGRGKVSTSAIFCGLDISFRFK
jgi:hypothetical protein